MNGMRWNERLVWWIIDDVFKHPKNKLLPRHLYCLRVILQPITWLRWKLERSPVFNYDMQRDIFTIYGKEFSGDFFRRFTFYFPEGAYFKIVKREGVVLTITRIYEQDFQNDHSHLF